jgi:hypothetical protein
LRVLPPDIAVGGCTKRQVAIKKYQQIINPIIFTMLASGFCQIMLMIVLRAKVSLDYFTAVPRNGSQNGSTIKDNRVFIFLIWKLFSYFSDKKLLFFGFNKLRHDNFGQQKGTAPNVSSSFIR